MSARSLKVSVVVPTRNAGCGFRGLLEKLSTQEGDFELEIVVIDSGSTDGTAELAEEYGATVHRIRGSEFNHGATRNLGISLTHGEYVALIVQDALPQDARWLAPMVENLERDGRVAVVYGRQLPRPGSDALTRALVNGLSTAGLERREQEISSPEAYLTMSPAERRRVAAFDNVSSCLRRSVWEKYPFEKTDFAEDLRWGKRVVEAGYKIVYEPRSAVVHSHERGALYDLRRHYVDQLVLAELFGIHQVPDLPRLVLGIPYSARHVYNMLGREEPGNKLRHALLAARHAIPTRLGVYLGGKAASIARLSPGLHARLHRFLSSGV